MQKLDFKPKPPIIGDWLLEGDIGFVFAKRGVGKTWFGMDLAKSIATSESFGPWETHGSRRVLYVDGEVSAAGVQQRNNALSIDSTNFVHLNHELLFEMEQKTMDIADPEQQRAFLLLCNLHGIKVVILDNLSCLAPMCDENNGVDWSSQLLNWVLAMRRNGITLIFIQHAGRSGEMRGHSRREDPANWIIRLRKDRE